MATVETLIKNNKLIAERSRSEPGEHHPFRRNKIPCNHCGKIIKVIEKNKRPDRVYFCKDCRGEHDLEWIEKITAKAQNRSPEYKAQLKDRLIKANTSYEGRKKQSCTKQGCSPEEFPGFKGNEPYCDKFDENLRERNREFFGRKCVWCEKPESENIVGKKQKKLECHHVYLEKKTCCETKIEDMENVRKRLPSTVAQFGSPEFSEEEIIYIRMLVPLCHHCHVIQQRERQNHPYENAPMRKFFTELILSKGGKCYYTKEEGDTPAELIYTYAVNGIVCEVN